MQSTTADAQATCGNGAANTASSQRNADAIQTLPAAAQPEKRRNSGAQANEVPRRQLPSGILDEILIAGFAV